MELYKGVTHMINKKTLCATLAVSTAVLSASVASADEVQQITTTDPVVQHDQSGLVAQQEQAYKRAQADQKQAIDVAQSNGVEVANEGQEEVNSQQEATQKTQEDTTAIINATKQQHENQANYEAQVKAYDAAKAELKANTTKEGYPSEVVEQGLKFEHNSEPATRAEVIKGEVVKEEEVQEAARNADTGDKDYLVNTVLDPKSNFIDSGTYVKLEAGVVTTVRYNNLVNTYYRGHKIKVVEFDYKAHNTDYAICYDDPTITIGLLNFSKVNYVDVIARFYDADGGLVELGSDALFNFGSLNRGKGEKYKDRIEWVKIDGGYTTINGSTIKVHDDDKAYADSSNDPEFAGNWDNPDSKDFYKGAIIGKVLDGKLSFAFGNTGRVWQWFAINTSIPVQNLPKVPVKPKKIKVTYKTYVVKDVPTVIPPKPQEPKPKQLTYAKPQRKEDKTPVDYAKAYTAPAEVKVPEHHSATLPKTGDSKDTTLDRIGAAILLVASLLLSFSIEITHIKKGSKKR